MKKEKNLGLFVSKELHDKLRFVARYDGRSAASMVRILLRRYIAEFEAEHGSIPPPAETEETL